MSDRQIAYCEIHPGIGIGRVGNSPDEFFIGPEAPGTVADPGDGFKDREGRIKRQAARFRVYAFDEQGKVIQELTSSDATITWTVQLANKKGAWHEFHGFAAENAADHGGDPLPWRNPNIPPADRHTLEIQPKPRSITGCSQHGSAYRFDDGTFLGTVVPLGELRTDEFGRLLVLGGFGHSASTAPDSPITHFANNDTWYDDISDGPVTATVVLKDASVLPVRASSWVIIAPPDFAPSHDNIVTLYDVMGELAVKQGWLPEPKTVSFTRDIYPLFQRIVGYQWVNATSLRGHGPGCGGNLLDPHLLAALSDNSAASLQARQRVFARIRNPQPQSDQEARDQASYYYMPQLSGDQGYVTEGEPATWLAVLESQYEHLRRWADGDFEADWKGVPPCPAFDSIPVEEQPAALGRAALEHCVGGPFFPGIEMTYIARDPSLYTGPFRFQPDLQPGDITKRMGVPWQADFYECQLFWWPAQRPDDVVSEAEYEAIVMAFQAEAADAKADVSRLLFNRERWDRGVAAKIRYHGDARQTVQRSGTTGDNEMVDKWSRLGFVTPRQAPNGDIVYVETERQPYYGLQDRDYFHIMLNLDAYPDFLPTARMLAEQFLAQAREFQNDPTLEDDLRAFPYSARAYDARLDKIYNELVEQAELYDPSNDPVFKAREDVVEKIRQFAPFNQCDGAWLRGVVQAGPIDEVRSLLFSIWMDEVGDGQPELNHANVYTDLLRSVGTYPEAINTRAYAYNPDLFDSAFTIPLFELVVSQFSQLYFPEILGMTLWLEWEVLELKRTIKLFEYFGLNAHFNRLHVGIDNAADGHGAKARRAVQLYLDQVRAESGEEAMQEHWSRVWNGYVAFRTVGNLGEDLRNKLLHPPSLTDRMVAMIQRKAPYARLNHDNKKLGANLINDWFDDPRGLLKELVDSGMIVKGDPDNSPFFNLLGFNGPMYKVFTEDEIKLWEDWVRSDEGEPPTPVETDAARLMVRLIETMRQRQTGTPGHQENQLTGPDPDHPGQSITRPVAWWFEQPAPALMTAVANPQNGWIVPGDAGKSRFVTDLLAGDNAMANALSGIAPGTAHKTWRSIAIDWINKGCPIPPPVVAAQVAAPFISREPAAGAPIRRLYLNSSPEEVLAHPHGRVRGNAAVH
jgi:L-Lysine epsilon oxidase N-terminal/L-lysine epsilon oxidase C-terminal domain/Iron-containing redox enzyme